MTAPDLANDVTLTEHNVKPPIYSRGAILAFSVLISPVFGGVLLMQNLIDIGKKRVAYMVLAVSIVYAIFCFLILDSIERRTNALQYFLSFAGGAFLTEYYFKKYFKGASQYPKKKLWKPIIIAVALLAVFLLIMFYADDIDALLYQ